jgi:hypothetical protein
MMVCVGYYVIQQLCSKIINKTVRKSVESIIADCLKHDMKFVENFSIIRSNSQDGFLVGTNYGADFKLLTFLCIYLKVHYRQWKYTYLKATHYYLK